MGHQFRIEGDEAAVTQALRSRLGVEQKRRAEAESIRKAISEFHGLLGVDPPSSNHDWLYDDKTGLPVW